MSRIAQMRAAAETLLRQETPDPDDPDLEDGPLFLGPAPVKVLTLLSEIGRHPALDAYLSACVPSRMYALGEGAFRVLGGKMLVWQLLFAGHSDGIARGGGMTLFMDAGGQPYLVSTLDGGVRLSYR